MLKYFFAITLALCMATMAYGQLLGGILGEDAEEDNGPLINIGLLNRQKPEPVSEIDTNNDSQDKSLDKNANAKRKMVLPTEELMKPFVKVNNKYYYFGQTKESWYQSNLICRSMGASLTAFDTVQESEAMSSYLVSKYPTDRWWWLSAADLATEGDFFWYKTGERMYNADWSVGQPDNAGGNEHCVHLWHTGQKYQMNDWNCKGKAYFICEADMPRVRANRCQCCRQNGW